MTVLQMGPVPPPQDGIQSNLMGIHRFLAENGIRSGLMSLTRHQGAIGDEIYHPRGAFHVATLLLRLPYSILHLHIGGAAPRAVLLLAPFPGFLPRRKAALSLHSRGDPPPPPRPA